MATLVLLFCVVFLVYEMFQRGQDPLDVALIRPVSQPLAQDDENPKTTREIQLYFTDGQSMALTPENRRIEFTDSTVENSRRALEALIEGPRDLLAPVLPPTTKIRGLYLLDKGELVVDFSRDLEAGHIKSASAELLMVHGIVASLAQPALKGRQEPPVRTVRFLFEGSPPQETFPAHIDLSEPVAPDGRWLSQEVEGPGDA